jgi:hypothetical protein
LFHNGSLHDWVLTRTPPGPLPGDHDATLEDLAAPDSPRFTPCKRTGQARFPDRAVGAEALGPFELPRRFREPQVCVPGSAGQIQIWRGHGVEQITDPGGLRVDELVG